MKPKQKFMAAAIEEARRGVLQNEGGPFGAVIVRGEEVVARGHNQVVGQNDPTAHAEMVAIRQAAGKLKTFKLDGCQLYTTCEPCPMCLAAIHWAGIRTIYFGCSRQDAEAIGFDDNLIFEMFSGRAKLSITSCQLDRKGCLEVFNLWHQKPDRIMY